VQPRRDFEAGDVWRGFRFFDPYHFFEDSTQQHGNHHHGGCRALPCGIRTRHLQSVTQEKFF
jgi:hypothetical protein